MDMQRDYDRFRKLIARLCATLDKFCTDELVESWWKALRHVDYMAVETRVDEFLARANDKTPFPRPSQMRPVECEPPRAGDAVGNHIRDYWRSCVVNEAARAAGLSLTAFEPVLIRHKDTLGRALRDLLDDLEQQERRDGRTDGQAIFCSRRAHQIARAHPEAHAQVAA